MNYCPFCTEIDTGENHYKSNNRMKFIKLVGKEHPIYPNSSMQACVYSTRIFNTRRQSTAISFPTSLAI